MESCTLCPRRCGADRSREEGLCGGGPRLRLARAALHMWEEPCISGTRGSGTVFFSGCALGCVFCQNAAISHRRYGVELSVERLVEIFLELQAQDAHNLNLVTAGHYVPWVVEALEQAKPRLTIPVVWNSSGYELPETLRLLAGLVDIYLPDLKYLDNDRAAVYSHAPDYPQIATAAIDEMLRQTGPCLLDADGLLRRGTLIRHLVLPAGKADSLAVVEQIAQRWAPAAMVSLMSQYTPQFYDGSRKELRRRVSSLEYNAVVERAAELSLQGFMQQREAATSDYTPDFNLQGVL